MGQVIVRNHDLNALASAENRESKNEARMLHRQIPRDSFSAEKLKTMRVKTVDVLFKNNLVILRSAARAPFGI